MQTQKLYNGVRYPFEHPCPANVRRLDMGAWPLIDKMHRTGVMLDTSVLAEVSERCQQGMASAMEQIVSIVGKKYAVNPASPLQVSKLLFTTLHIQGESEVPITATGGYSTGADTLELFRDAHPVVDPILEWRQFQKLDGTYARKLPKMISPVTGRIHTRFKTTRTATGRLSSEDPNLQNIPASEEGKHIRRAFVAQPGWRLIGRDLSQIEMRVITHLSGEPTMVKGYHTPDWDMHTQTAMDVFHLERDQVDKAKHRAPAKTCGFGVVYLIGPDGLQKTIASAGGGVWTIEQCESLLKAFYAARPAIRTWQEDTFAFMRRHGYVCTQFGRYRIIPQIRSTLGHVESAGLREGANQPVQGMAGDILKLAMAYINDLMDNYNRGEERVRALLQVHDELIFEVKEQYADEWGELIRPAMEDLVEMIVPISSSLAIGDNWMELK